MVHFHLLTVIVWFNVTLVSTGDVGVMKLSGALASCLGAPFLCISIGRR